MSKLKKISLEDLSEAAKNSFSAAETCRMLNLPDSGGNITRLKILLKSNMIDVSHWTGQLWSKGKTSIDDSRVRRKPVEEIFCENSNASSGYVRSLIIKKKLLPYKCSKEKCNNEGEWLGEKLNLQLDHINGNRKDQRIENLRWLCPNCHSQTDTFCGKNVKNKRVADEDLVKALRESSNIRQALIKVNLDNGRHYNRAKKLIEKHQIGGLVELADTRASNTREGQILLTGASPVSATKIAVVHKRCVCGKDILRKYQKHCSYECAYKTNRKVDWDSLNLQELIKQKSVLQLSKQLGVSDNAIHKRLKRMGLK